MRGSNKLPLMAVLAGLAGMSVHGAGTAAKRIHSPKVTPWLQNLPKYADVAFTANGGRSRFKINARRQGNRKTLPR